MGLKAKTFFLILLCTLILTGCVDNTNSYDSQKHEEHSLFKEIDTIEYKSDELLEITQIVVDKETGVNYIVIQGGIKITGLFKNHSFLYYSITPRYDSNGNVIVTP